MKVKRTDRAKGHLFLVNSNLDGMGNHYSNYSRRFLSPQNLGYENNKLRSDEYLLKKGETDSMVSEMKNELETIIKELLNNESAYTNDGGDRLMEQLKEKISDIDKRVAVIEEKTRKIDDLPTKEEMKLIIYEALDNRKLVTSADVELQITKARNTQILWTVGTIITAAAILIRFF